jgi:hypothetical protein
MLWVVGPMLTAAAAAAVITHFIQRKARKKKPDLCVEPCCLGATSEQQDKIDTAMAELVEVNKRFDSRHTETK